MYQPPQYQRLLTPELEIELARRVHGSDAALALEARDELVLCNIGLVGKIVGRMVNHWPNLEYDEMFSEAMVALVQVAERYDPDEHRTRFSSYAVPYIRGRLLNFVNYKSRRAESYTELDDHADPAPPALERIILAEEFSTAVTALGKLAPLKAYIIARRFGIGELEVSSLRQIACDLECSYEYVRRLQIQAINHLSLNTRI